MFYVYNDKKDKLIDKSPFFNPTVEQIYSDKDIPLEFCKIVDCVLCDSREL